MPKESGEDGQELLGMKLDGFRIEGRTEVYKVDDLGRRTYTIGFLPDEIAAAFVQHQTKPGRCRERKVLVITNGKTGFLLGEDARILNDVEEALKVQKMLDAFDSITKLPPEEREAALRRLQSEEQ